MDYRSDIDGLRAIAVLSVFIYHLGAQWLPGGFIGVDVFFVISGFLITGIIRKQVASGSFSYFSFFVRRIRRITPALLFMTVSVVVAGFLVLKPAELVPLYKSALTQPFAVQNMYFLMEGEYFNGSDRKPLLHTWSLGVEEQFYLIWPLLMIVLSKLSRAPVITFVSILLVGSFVVNILLLPISPKASFFLFPARTWELAAGGLLAILMERRDLFGTRPWLREIISLVGLGLLLVGFLFMNSALVFPGWYALVPVGGTLMLISASKGTGLGAVMSLRPVVWIGLISYSLYLWHWPVIVFARVLEYDMRSPIVVVAIIVCASLLALASYAFIEQPIRDRRLFKSQKRLIASFISVTTAIGFLSFIAIKTHGFSFRYPEPGRSMLTASFNADGDGRCGFIFRILNPKDVICHINSVPSDTRKGVLVWGDSHAAMWIGVISRLGNEQNMPVYLSTRNCRPTPDFDFCGRTTQESVLQSIEDAGITDVVLASKWSDRFGFDDARFELELEKVVERLIALNTNIWMVVDTPAGEKLNPIKQYEKSPNFPRIGRYPYSFFEGQFLPQRSLFQRIEAASSKISVIDPTEAVCPGKNECMGGIGDEIWYRDDDHLTSVGASKAREMFQKLFVEDDSQ